MDECVCVCVFFMKSLNKKLLYIQFTAGKKRIRIKNCVSMQIDVFIFYLIIRIVPHTAEMRTSQYKMSHWQQHANSAVDSVEIRFVMAKSKLYCFFSQLMINISNNDVTKKKSFASQSYCPKNVMISISDALLAHVQF